MKNELTVFGNGEFGEVRTTTINTQPYFVASDVAKALGYAKPRNAVEQHCRGALKQGVPHPQSPNKILEVTVIPESDVYRLIVRSKLPSAEKFETWVMEEVLPTIRKTGGYIPISKEDSDADIMAKAFLIAKSTLEQKEELIKQLEPKANDYDLLMNSYGDIDIGEFAKVSKVNIGRNKFFTKLREECVLMNNNIPYQKHIDADHFKVVMTVKGGMSFNKTLITKKGIKYLMKKCEQWGLLENFDKMVDYNF